MGDTMQEERGRNHVRARQPVSTRDARGDLRSSLSRCDSQPSHEREGDEREDEVGEKAKG